MDPITAISLVSAIVAFVDIGSKIAKRLEELSSAGDAPRVFRDLRTRLPLVLQIVERTRDGAEGLTPESRASVNAVVRNCYEHVEKLDEILQRVTVGQNDTRWNRGTKAVISLMQEARVARISEALKDNVQLLTSLNVSPIEDRKASLALERRTSIALPPPSYQSSEVQFHVPFERDENFIGRQQELDTIRDGFKSQNRIAISGIGGVGKSQVAIEFCYRHKELEPSSHIFWVWGGNAARFKQGYKRIAQSMALPGWNDPDVDILQLVADWLSHPVTPYLLVLDNADNMKDWWPTKYASMAPNDTEPALNLATSLPDCGDKGRMLITTRDNRIATRLAIQGKPIPIQSMSLADAKELFLSKAAAGEHYEPEKLEKLVHELDYLPLAISQAAAYLEENEYYTIIEYLEALKTDDSEEFLQEELHDTRRDQDSFNSIFKTWKLSFDQIRAQKPMAADLLSMMSIFDRQSIPKALLGHSDEFRTGLTTALGTLNSFHLIIVRANKVSFQLHRLVHRFVQSHIRRTQTGDRWRAAALKCLTKAYPVEIGAAQFDWCESLNPHVLTLIGHTYTTDDANLDLATLLCWSADFAVEKNELKLATSRAQKSLAIFKRLVPETDGRRASSTWLYGRLLYYQAWSHDEISSAASMLEDALRISEYKTLSYAESAFELAHLYFDQGQKEQCLKMGFASYACWKDTEGADSQRALDNLHDLALELALFGDETSAIAKWNEILKHCSTSHNSSMETRKVFELRSMASIAEFSDDPAMAEILYQELISLCGSIYNEHHVHVYDYQLCHSEQILRQGRLGEAAEAATDILSRCQHKVEWLIRAGSRQIMSECCRQQGDLEGEEAQLVACLEIYEESLSRLRAETITAIEALAHCLIRAGKAEMAVPLWKEIYNWRKEHVGPECQETVRALICLGVCYAEQSRDSEAEEAFSDALSRTEGVDTALLHNLCVVQWNQRSWSMLEATSQEALLQWSKTGGDRDDGKEVSRSIIRSYLAVALEQQGKAEACLAVQAANLGIKDSAEGLGTRQTCIVPPLPLRRRFGRLIHPRTWSA